ncbi:MAG: histidine kinase, partial [Bacteroidales bacterium]|nr:histidine kinase [Bacteroidales bacterium]
GTDGFIYLNDQLDILDVNQAIRQMLGYGHTSFPNTIDELIRTHLNKKVAYTSMLRYIRTKKPDNSIKIGANTLTNQKLMLSVSIFQVDIENNPMFWITIKNISASENLERVINNAMIIAEEKERERYAKDLHDGLNPILSTCLVYANSLESNTDKDKTRGYVNRLTELLEMGIQSVKEISANISPLILYHYGLTKAIEDYISKLDKLSDIKVSFSPQVHNDIKLATAINLYRILAELFNNTIRHANASLIYIQLTESNNMISLQYEDNGKGFACKCDSNLGSGLKNIKHRLKKIGGDISIQSSRNKGVKVNIEVRND